MPRCHVGAVACVGLGALWASAVAPCHGAVSPVNGGCRGAAQGRGFPTVAQGPPRRQGWEVSRGNQEAAVEVHESGLQEDGTTFPPVTPDVPAPPGTDVPEVPEMVQEKAPPAEPGV